jgi:hypothetical protein
VVCRAFFPPCRHCIKVIPMCCIGCPWSHQGTWKQLFDPWIPVPISNVSCQCYFESSLESRSLTLSDVFCKRVWFSKAKLGVTLTVGRCRCHLSPGTGRAKRFGLSSGIDRKVAWVTPLGFCEAIRVDAIFIAILNRAVNNRHDLKASPRWKISSQ